MHPLMLSFSTFWREKRFIRLSKDCLFDILSFLLIACVDATGHSVLEIEGTGRRQAALHD